MNGVFLRKLSASDMLDVIHALFEEDASGTSREQFEMRSKFREIIYKDFYGRDYAFALKTKDKWSNRKGPRLDGPMDNQGPGLSAVGAPVPRASGTNAVGPGSERASFADPFPTGRSRARCGPRHDRRTGSTHQPYVPPTHTPTSVPTPFRPSAGLDSPMFYHGRGDDDYT